MRSDNYGQLILNTDDAFKALYSGKIKNLDKILFDNGINQQDVDLVTLVQDANFIFPGRDPLTMEIDKLTIDGEPTSIQGRFLEDSELVFSNTKPTVIYGYAAVPSEITTNVTGGTSCVAGTVIYSQLI